MPPAAATRCGVKLIHELSQVWDFLPRVAAAGGIDMETPRKGEHGPNLSVVLYFLDLSHVRAWGEADA